MQVTATLCWCSQASSSCSTICWKDLVEACRADQLLQVVYTSHVCSMPTIPWICKH